jgi:hypothetical protein
MPMLCTQLLLAPRSQYALSFAWKKFATSTARDAITGARLQSIAWGLAGSPAEGCTGHGAFEKPVFSAKHAQYILDDLKTMALFEHLPSMHVPVSPALKFHQNEIYIYQLDPGTNQSRTVFYGPATFALQHKLHLQFATHRMTIATAAFARDWASVTAFGWAVDTEAAAAWLRDTWGCVVAGMFTTQEV